MSVVALSSLPSSFDSTEDEEVKLDDDGAAVGDEGGVEATPVESWGTSDPFNVSMGFSALWGLKILLDGIAEAERLRLIKLCKVRWTKTCNLRSEHEKSG